MLIMFFLSSLSKEICILPKDLTGDTKTLLESKIKDLVGKIIGKHGYIVAIIDFNQMSKGKIDNETGRVNFKINYKAVTFNLVVGEILISRPFHINEYGFFCKVGPCQIFVSKHHLNPQWEYNSDKNIWVNETSVVSIGEPVNLKITASGINSEEISGLAKIVCA